MNILVSMLLKLFSSTLVVEYARLKVFQITSRILRFLDRFGLDVKGLVPYSRLMLSRFRKQKRTT